MTETLNGAQITVRLLERQGIRIVTGYPREEAEKLEAAVVQEVNRKISQEYEGIHICVKEP